MPNIVESTRNEFKEPAKPANLFGGKTAHVATPAPPETKPSKFLTTIEAAEYLGGLKPATLEIWRVRGTSPIYYRCGRLIRYKIKDLDAWLETRARTSTTELSA
jgi:hypothetical protein